ncbi:MAG: hypothetical protein KO206_06030 [Methanomicrobiaceae archaeon]|uniref:Uncharacterized protein n=1 Tax=hydrocarbon metagenome TaxID=938273 RepID=A0A0W8FHV7_9ZZZZ|nr:hypothetical protein [Methanomicrobiaceae archaeon]MDD5420044.1 hypothetical protein [Methanomicrobiaceae archaeon]
MHHPEFGYLNLPGATPGYLEHLAAGVQASARAGLPAPPPQVCRAFIRKCRAANGGYARSIYGGSATLENTRTALAALAALDGHREYAGDEP